jgi:biotin synthase-related radical SAM superfamily protein
MVMKVRASMGTLGVLGLELIQMDAPPTTAYLQIYTEERCRANCLFCAQASHSHANITHIARGMYIPADLDSVVKRLELAYDRGYLKRACVQTVLYDMWWDDTIFLIKSIRERSKIPISLSVFPLGDEKYNELRTLGVNELVIPIDACTPELFDKIKGKGTEGPYSWENHMDGIRRASQIFENVGTHLIIGLGETDEEAVKIIDDLWKHHINSALFSYTYIPGAQILPGNKDDIRHYRVVQLARYLITEGLASYSGMEFLQGDLFDFGVEIDEIMEIIEMGTAFQTSGCPACNRPMANETFSRIYNFPRAPTRNEILQIKNELGIGHTRKL